MNIQTTEPLNENHDDFSRLLVIMLWIMFGFLHRHSFIVRSQGDYYLEPRRLLSCLKVSVVIDMHFKNDKRPRFQLKIVLFYWRKLSNLKLPTSRMACPGVSTLTAHFRFYVNYPFKSMVTVDFYFLVCNDKSIALNCLKLNRLRGKKHFSKKIIQVWNITRVSK